MFFHSEKISYVQSEARYTSKQNPTDPFFPPMQFVHRFAGIDFPNTILLRCTKEEKIQKMWL